MEWACGGGTILIFLLTTFLSIEQHIAQGTNLIFFIPTSIAAIIASWKNKNIEINTFIPVSICGIIGAIIGAKLSVNMDVMHLRKYFGFFLLFIAINEIFSLIKLYIKKRKS